MQSPQWAQSSVAGSAVAIALWSDRRARKRFDVERADHHSEIADERARHDREVSMERDLADKRLADERARSDARLKEERDALVKAEQLAEAWAVDVVTALAPAGMKRTLDLEEVPIDDDPQHPQRRLAVIIVNRGRYGIRAVKAHYWFGERIHSYVKVKPMWNTAGLRPELTRDLEGPTGYLDVLSPGSSMRYVSDPMLLSDLERAYPIVRWRDRQG